MSSETRLEVSDKTLGLREVRFEIPLFKKPYVALLIKTMDGVRREFIETRVENKTMKGVLYMANGEVIEVVEYRRRYLQLTKDGQLVEVNDLAEALGLPEVKWIIKRKKQRKKKAGKARK